MPLGDREGQVLDQVIQGNSQTKEIARSLGLSPRTVEIYRSNVLHKMGARNAVDLVPKVLIREEA
jgi:DNA-binding CsgD family transcriptional regulator